MVGGWAPFVYDLTLLPWIIDSLRFGWTYCPDLQRSISHSSRGLYRLEYAISLFCRNVRNCSSIDYRACPHRVMGPPAAPVLKSQNSLTGAVIIWRCDWLSVRKRVYSAHKCVKNQSARTVILCRKFVVERLSPGTGIEAKSLGTQIDRRSANRSDMLADKQD